MTKISPEMTSPTPRFKLTNMTNTLSGRGERILPPRFRGEFSDLANIGEGLLVRRDDPYRHRHERNLFDSAVGFRSLHESLLTIHEVVMSLDFRGEAFFDTLFDARRRGGIGDDNKVVAPGVADEIAARAKFIHHLADQHGRKPHHTVPRHKAVYVLEGIEVIDAHIQQSPLLFADDAAQLLFDQPPGGESRTRIGQALALGAADGALHAQFQFLDIEQIGR